MEWARTPTRYLTEKLKLRPAILFVPGEDKQSDLQKIQMKIKNCILLSTAVATVIFGIGNWPAQAAKPNNCHVRHSNHSIYLQQGYSSPDATSWYQPLRSPAFSEDFGS